MSSSDCALQDDDGCYYFVSGRHLMIGSSRKISLVARSLSSDVFHVPNEFRIFC